MEAERPPNRKEKLTIAGQIEDLRRRGVRFDAGEVELARDCLAHRRSLLHLSAYRTLFPKHLEGPHKGKYIDLSFGDLVMLDELDSQLRDTFLKLTLEVENAARMRILTTVSESPIEDGYEIVRDFLASLPPRYHDSICSELDNRSDPDQRGFDIYHGNLTRKYLHDMPVWVFVEVVSFGPLLSLYRFCAERWGDREMLQDYYTLKQVKDVRNACAHQSCIINGFSKQEETSRRPSKVIYKVLNEKGLRVSRAQKTKMSNSRIQQLICVIVVYSKLIKGGRQVKTQSINKLSQSLRDVALVYARRDPMKATEYLYYLADCLDLLLGADV